MVGRIEIDKRSEYLIDIMTEELNNTRINLLKIKDKKKLNKLINDSTIDILNLNVDFVGMSDDKIKKIKDLKEEWLVLFSMYREV